LCTSLCHFK